MKKFSLPAIIAAIFVSCTTLEPSLAPLSQPGYSDFYSAYKKALTVVEATPQNGSTLLVFSDKSSTVLKGVEIEDCSKSNPKIVAFTSNGEWMVGGVGTGIQKREQESNEQSIVIYLYRTNLKLYAFLSNGSKISMEYKPESQVTPGPGPGPGPGPDPEPRPHQGTPEIKSYPSYGKVTLPTLHLNVSEGNYWNQNGWWDNETQAWYEAKDEYNTGTIKITDPSHVYWNKDEWSSSEVKFRGRGNSTWGMPKKPYKIKFESKQAIFDVAKDKEWCILANYADKTLIRNLTAMEISRTLGFDWTPRMFSVNVYFNDKYAGVYTFAEHKKVSSNRVNIDVDGGDLYFEIETNMDEPCCWRTDHGMPMMFSEPSEPSIEVQNYAKKFFRDFETTLWDNTNSKKFDDPNHHYSQYIDVDSFVDYYIIQELTKNIDGQLKKSTFITLPLNGKLCMYHVWDFDLTMGNCDYYDRDGLNSAHGNEPTGWWIRDRACNGVGHGWIYRLFQDPAFVQKVRDRWHQVYPALKENIPAFIKQQSDLLTDSNAQQENFRRWNILSTYVWPNWKVTGSYSGEVGVLLDYYTRRLEWINNNIDK